MHARYGNVAVQAWGRMHPRLARRGGWVAHPGRLPIIEGTLIHIQVDRLPGNRAPRPVWHSHTDTDQLDLCHDQAINHLGRALESPAPRATVAARCSR